VRYHTISSKFLMMNNAQFGTFSRGHINLMADSSKVSEHNHFILITFCCTWRSGLGFSYAFLDDLLLATSQLLTFISTFKQLHCHTALTSLDKYGSR
jgi:hypothetical protein